MNNISIENSVVIEPLAAGSPDAVVIWLHGLGADGHDFEGIVAQLQLPPALNIRFIFPHAPIQPVTINGGMEMRSWYDIRSLDFFNDFDAAGVRVSTVKIADLIDQQVRQGIEVSKILLAGFSQGGLVALHCALSYPQKLAGVMALSTYCPMSEQFYLHRDLPILMMHGDADPVIPFEVAQASRQALHKQGYEVEWLHFPMQHQVVGEQLPKIRDWIVNCLR